MNCMKNTPPKKKQQQQKPQPNKKIPPPPPKKTQQQQQKTNKLVPIVVNRTPKIVDALSSLLCAYWLEKNC